MPRKKLYQDQGEETKAFSIRMPESMKKAIEDLAWQHRRSVNQEIIWLLENGLQLLEKEQSRASKQSPR